MPGGTQSAGPYELRLPIFLQPLGGALKNRSAAPASPPCFRRRRTGCGTQHPLRLACVSLAAAPTTPRGFRRWRRSSSLQSAPLLFESTLAALYKLPDKTETPVSLQHWSSWWARVDYASRAAKNSLAGCFCAVFGDSAAAVRIHPWICFEKFRTKEKLQHLYDAGVFGGRGWIRTTEAEKQQIYSLSPLATREHAHIQFFTVTDCLYILPLGGVFVNCFLQLFQKRS